MFENFRTFETDFAGRPLVIETGKMAQLANGECLVRYGDTVVHVAVTASAKPREGVDFFPLSVDFEEKLYAVGKIPGSFLKREGRPSDKAILTSRVIDRPIRPLFPKDMRNDVSVVCTVMSVDHDCLPEIAAMVGTSIALTISDIPWNGPISGVSVGLIDGEYIINPTSEQREKSRMAVTVASTDERIAMIEAGAKIVTDEEMYNGIMAGHEANQKIIEFIKGIQKEIGKEKFSYPSNEPDEEMLNAIKEFAMEDVKYALDTDDKNVRDERLKPIYEKVHEKFDPIYPEQEAKIEECMYRTQKYIVRRWLLDEQKRVDGRQMDQMRPLAAEIDLLPRVHGSGMFTRGQTQVLTVATLGPVSDQQMLDGIDEEEFKRYIHQYTAHLIDRVDDPAAGCFVKHVEDLLTQSPALHKQAFESHGVRQESEPEQMAVDTAHLAPDGAQVSGPGRDLDVHDVLHRLAVAHAVHEAADAAGPLHHIGHLVKILLLHQALQPSVDETDGGNGLDDLLILDDQIQMNGLRQHRVLRSVWYDTSLSHLLVLLLQKRRLGLDPVEFVLIIRMNALDFHAEQLFHLIFVEEGVGVKRGNAGHLRILLHHDPQGLILIGLVVGKGIAQLIFAVHPRRAGLGQPQSLFFFLHHFVQKHLRWDHFHLILRTNHFRHLSFPPFPVASLFWSARHTRPPASETAPPPLPRRR